MALNPDDYVAAQVENKIMMDKLIEKAKIMDAEDWGEVAVSFPHFIGQVLV